MRRTESRWLEPSQRGFCTKVLVETHGCWQSRADLAGSRHKRAFSWGWSSWNRADTVEQTTYMGLWGNVAGKAGSIF